MVSIYRHIWSFFLGYKVLIIMDLAENGGRKKVIGNLNFWVNKFWDRHGSSCGRLVDTVSINTPIAVGNTVKIWKCHILGKYDLLEGMPYPYYFSMLLK